MPEIMDKSFKLKRGNKTYVLPLVRWEFTQNERDEYFRALKDRASTDSIETFLSVLENYCKYQYFLKKHDVYEKQKALMRELKKNVLLAEKLLDRLQDIKAGKNYSLPYNVEEMSNALIPQFIRDKAEIYDPPWLFNKEMRSAAVKAIDPLSEFINTSRSIKDVYSNDRTKKRADKSGLIKAIGRLYLMYIEIPTTSNGKAFETVVKLTLEYLNLPYEAPDRPIKDALRILKNTPFYVSLIKKHHHTP